MSISALLKGREEGKAVEGGEKRELTLKQPEDLPTMCVTDST
jgi:hypothetical protein